LNKTESIESTVQGNTLRNKLKRKNMKLKIYATAIALFMGLCAAWAQTTVASGNCGASGSILLWTLKSNGVLTIAGTGAMADFSFESSPWYAKRTSITSVIIEDGVTTIGNNALRDCSNLTSVTIGNSVTKIGSYAFMYCSRLPSITIPASVTNINTQIFANCSKLTSIEVDAANTKYSSLDDVLYNKAQTTLITYPEGKAGDFSIPNSVTTIGNMSFQRSIGLTSITIPNSVTMIEGYAFFNCNGLTSVIIPNSVTTIESAAFSNCQNLTSVTIPNSLTTLEGYMFSQCISLTSVTIPNSLTTIREHAFQYCTGLTSITCEAVAPPALLDDVFLEVPTGIAVCVPAGSEAAYQAAEGWNNFTNIRGCAPTAVGEVQAASPLRVHPNPAKYEINIGNGEFKIENVEIVDLSGKTLSSFNNQAKINVSALPQGIYFIKINTGRGILTEKFVKE
jgi:hypothetical protein